MRHFDIVLRSVVERHSSALAQVLLPSFPVDAATWVETQLATHERRMDKALELRSAGRRRLLHLEIAVDPRRPLPYRMWEYSAQLVMAQQAPANDVRGDEDTVEAAATDAPVESAVLVLSGRKRPWPAEGQFRISPPECGFSGHRFRIEAVYQRTVQELWNRPGSFWLVFTPLAVDANVDSMRDVLKELRRREPDDTERAALHAALFVLADLDPWGHHLREEVKRMLWELDRQSIMASPALRDVFQEGLDEGRKEGLNEGRKEGLKEGLDEGRKEAIERMLRGLLVHHLRRDLTGEERSLLASRAGTLDPAQAAAIVQLDPDALQAWLFGPDAE